jgi:hypothetical protein
MHDWGVSYRIFTDKVWGVDYDVTEYSKKSIQQNIKQLRKILGKKTIKTLQEGGYSLTVRPRLIGNPKAKMLPTFEMAPDRMEEFLLYANEQVRSTIEEMEKTKAKLEKAKADGDKISIDAYTIFLTMSSDKLSYFYQEYEKVINRKKPPDISITEVHHTFSGYVKANNNYFDVGSIMRDMSNTSNDSETKAYFKNDDYVGLNVDGKIMLVRKPKTRRIYSHQLQAKRRTHTHALLNQVTTKLCWCRKMQMLILAINDDLYESGILQKIMPC